MPSLLLIDDDTALVPEQVRRTFGAPGYRVSTATSGEAGLRLLQSESPDVVLLDLRLPDRSGLDVFDAIRAIDARIPVIFVTTAKTADTAIEAMKRGAYDYLTKPLAIDRLRATVEEALEVRKRMHEPVVLAQSLAEGRSDEVIYGSCPAMLDVYKQIGRVAAQDVTILITGESGTGKEVVARAIYQHSARAKAPFLALNCAAIPENLLESELFGHERGAFTGADRRRIGKFEQCSGGTILLDEIGDMPIALQAKVLRVLQERTFERVGGNETVRADVRIIAATHRNLKARAAEERFRSDLYYRLGVFTIHLPPLRERGEDLSALARHFARRYARELGRDVQDIAPDAMEKLRAYSWPGNVRELQSVLKQALLQAQGPVLLATFLPPLAQPERATRSSDSPGSFDVENFVRRRLGSGGGDVYAETHSEIDRVLFAHALSQTRGNHRDAAKLLGISRQTMRVKMRALGLEVTRSLREVEEDTD